MARNFWTLLDYSAEKTTHSVNSPDITAANFAAQETARNAYQSSMLAIQNGILNKNGFGNEVTGLNTPDPDAVSQREMKWLVTYEGNVSGKLFQVELGCAAYTAAGLLVANTDLANLANVLWTNYITAFEAFVKSPDDPTEAVSFLSARLVGRNI